MEIVIENDSCFFRQNPLAADGKAVKSKLTSSSLRKTLLQIGDRCYVAMSEERVIMDVFANTLAVLGAENAIYLVDSTSYGLYRT